MAPCQPHHILASSKSLRGRTFKCLEKGTSTAKSVTVSFCRSSQTKLAITRWRLTTGTTRGCSPRNTPLTRQTLGSSQASPFAGDTTGTLDNDSANSFHVSWWLANGSDWTSGTFTTGWEGKDNSQPCHAQSGCNLADSTSNEWYMTGVQMELGENASDLEHRSFMRNWLCVRGMHMPTKTLDLPDKVVGF